MNLNLSLFPTMYVVRNLTNILLELMATSSSQRLAEGRTSELFLLVPSVVVSGPKMEIFTPILESMSNLKDHFLVSLLCQGFILRICKFSSKVEFQGKKYFQRLALHWLDFRSIN